MIRIDPNRCVLCGMCAKVCASRCLHITDGRTAALAVSHDRGEDPIFRGAPCAVFACAEGTYALDIVNCSIAVTTLDLMLPVLGLGGCWAGFAMRAAAMDDKVCEAMNVEKGLRPLAGLMIGRPAVHYKRIPERRALRIRTVKGENA